MSGCTILPGGVCVSVACGCFMELRNRGQWQLLCQECSVQLLWVLLVLCTTMCRLLFGSVLSRRGDLSQSCGPFYRCGLLCRCRRHSVRLQHVSATVPRFWHASPSAVVACFPLAEMSWQWCLASWLGDFMLKQCCLSLSDAVGMGSTHLCYVTSAPQCGLLLSPLAVPLLPVCLFSCQQHWVAVRQCDY